MTKKTILFTAIIFLIVPVLFAQTPGESILQSYERIFVRSSLNTKVNVLSDAANDEAAAEFYGPLCEIALRFVLHNAALFRDDPDMISISVAAVRGVGDYAYTPASETVWQTFLRFSDFVIRYEILEVLPVLDTISLTGKINEFLVEQNRRHNLNVPPDYQILSSLFAILGKTGDESCYPVLFSSSLIYSGSLGDEAMNAMLEIPGDIYGFCMKVIFNNSPEEKLTAFKLALSLEDLSEEQKGELAETALEVALFIPFDRRNEILELTGTSIRLIREAGWVRSLPQVIKCYNQSLSAFRVSLSYKQLLIDVIDCLGTMKSAEAARALALQLGLYNSRLAELEKEEHDVILALIGALGQLAYKASYDGLYYASILPYPDDIINAAQNALSELKW